MMNKLIIATKNQGKVKDFKQLFAGYGVEVVSLLDLSEPVPDIEENGSTFKENAATKAETISQLFQLPVLADDSGLVVDSLGGRPGIYSARYAGESKSDKANVEKLLKELKGKKTDERQARFICVLAIARPGHETLFTEGRCEGEITEKPYGTNGFGYDPVFCPSGMERTMAELSLEEKNQISHRRQAINELKEEISRFF